MGGSPVVSPGQHEFCSGGQGVGGARQRAEGFDGFAGEAGGFALGLVERPEAQAGEFIGRFPGVGGAVKDVVDNLEGQSEGIAVGGEGLDPFGVAGDRESAHADGGVEEVGGLVLMHKGDGIGVAAAAAADVLPLTADDAGAAGADGEGVDQLGQGVGRGGGSQNLEGESQQGIAGQDGIGFAVYLVKRGFAAAFVIVVHAWQIVMNEGVGMQDLDGHGGGQGRLELSARGFRGGEA